MGSNDDDSHHCVTNINEGVGELDGGGRGWRMGENYVEETSKEGYGTLLL